MLRISSLQVSANLVQTRAKSHPAAARLSSPARPVSGSIRRIQAPLFNLKNSNFVPFRQLHTSRSTLDDAKAQKPPQSEAVSADAIRSAMRQFLLRVHPDFFQKYPSIQQSNERALKQTNQLLDILEDYGSRSGPIVLDPNRVPQKLSVNFFLREMKPSKEAAEAVPDPENLETHKKASKKKGEKQFKSVTATISFASSFFNTPFPRQRLDYECRVFINALLEQAGLQTIPLPEVEGMEIEEEVKDKKKKSETNEMSARQREKLLWAHEMKSLLRDALNRHYTAENMLIDSMGGRQVFELGTAGIPFELNKHEQKAMSRLYLYGDNTKRMQHVVHFSPQLTGEQKGEARKALQRLWDEKRLPEDVPVLITESTYLTPSELEGFVVIPHNFHSESKEKPLPTRVRGEEPPPPSEEAANEQQPPKEKPSTKTPALKFEQYLSLYLPEIVQQRQRIRETIIQTEFHLQEIQDALELSELTLKVGLSDAKVAASRIVKSLKTLNHSDNFNDLNNMNKDIREDEEDDDEDNDADDDDLVPKKKPNNSEKPQQRSNQQQQNSEPLEKIPTMHLLRNVGMHIVPGGQPEFDADRDIFIVPATISPEGFVEALRENRPILEMRQRLNPHATEFATEYWRLLKTLAGLAGVKAIILDGPAVKNKIVQVYGAQTIKKHAKRLREMGLTPLTLVISDQFGVDAQRRMLFVPPVFEIADLERYLEKTAETMQRLNEARR